MIITQRRLRDEKIAQLKQGHSAYAESHELIRLMKRNIEREDLHVHYDIGRTGCWFIPLTDKISS
ncbi:hypothetical protein [Lentibacillus sediminis]|uniref:hypothetical protein n=1 Tax=Lentibacillus sediminis TaxID=1940529 RepID=UPI000C1C7557|nr:hypothetical protein [Lentibacillus sediminis]